MTCQLFLEVLMLFGLFHNAISKQPHIVFILADDLGWNDVGFHNPTMKTPNIDKLANEGVILNSSYVQPVCTPSRHSIMTGIYPFKSGLQNGVIMPNRPECSPLKNEFLPRKLQKLGYATHMVGKWHLGMCSWNCTPTFRGFDSFFGYYNGQEDYYNKTIGIKFGGILHQDSKSMANIFNPQFKSVFTKEKNTDKLPKMDGEKYPAGGFDFRDNQKPIKNNTYSAFIYADRAKSIISNHDKSRPLFLYLPFQNVHAPIQVPSKYEAMYPDIKSEGRRNYCGMVSILDEAIGNITDSLKQNGLYDDTVIIFSADNGGMPNQYGNNYPLRGAKTTIYEGGTRASAFVHGAGLNKTGYVYDGLIHAVDWHPTVLDIAGGTSGSEIDGKSQWVPLTNGGDSNREDLVYNLDLSLLPVTGAEAIRSGDFKLIHGFPGPFPGWYKPDQYENLPPIGTQEDENEIYREAAERAMYDGNGNLKLFGTKLYNLKDDPNEHHDISAKNPKIVEQLKQKLEDYKKDYVAPMHPRVDPKSNPSNWDGYWTPGWC